MEQKKTEERNATPQEAAAALGVSVATLTRWKNAGCPYTESKPYGIDNRSSRPRYNVEEVKKWIAGQGRKEGV